MLTRMLQNAVRADPARVAVVQGTRRVRYDQLEDLAGRAAAGLRRLGVGPGDCVAVGLPNGPEFVATLFACARLRAVLLPLHPRGTAEEWLSFLADARTKVAIVDVSRADCLGGAGVTVTGFDGFLGSPAEPPPEEPFEGPALYLYTTGSTAARKRLCCTQRNLYYEALNFVETVGLTVADNILCTIPLSHSYGMGNCLLDAVYAGSTLVFLDAETAPFAACCPRLFDLVRAEAIRFYPGVPYQFHVLAGLPQPGPELAALKLCVSSGDLLPRETYDRFLERYGLPIRSLYGSTEAGSIAVNTDPDAAMRFGSLGRPLKNVTIRIREAGRELPAGQAGQIWVKSPVLPPTGYDNLPELTAQVFQDGYYDSGDVGRIDERGHLVLTGRKQTFVEVGGYKVDLAEVEEALQGHPRVREAAALGVEVPELGTILKAAVVADGCDEAELRNHCGRRLAPFKVPRVLEFRDHLPRGPLGKVLRSELGEVGDYPAGVRRADFDRAWSLVVARSARERLEFLTGQVQEQAALTLRRGQVDRSASFRDLGFDSLLAAELHLRLGKLTGLPLSITLLWNYPTPESLAGALLAQLGPETPGPPEPPVGAGADVPAAASLADLIRGVGALSDADVDATLLGGPRP
jgi:long-chain acyl-CoA synthetase